jgi:hypothetical protein
MDGYVWRLLENGNIRQLQFFDDQWNLTSCTNRVIVIQSLQENLIQPRHIDCYNIVRDVVKREIRQSTALVIFLVSVILLSNNARSRIVKII